MKTAVSVPDPLFDAAERLARRLRVSRSELYQRAVAAYVQSHRDENVTEALNSVYADEPETSALDNVLERLQSASLPDEKW
jgi:metal-responsive CopG/Arc/MetJ family transcriptional regulator